MLYHDSHDAQYRDPLGPSRRGNRLTLRFACDESPEVLLRTWDGAERLYPMVSVGESLYEATVTVPDKPMLFWYDFIIRRADGDVRYGNSRDQLGGEGACYDGQPDSYQVTVYDPRLPDPGIPASRDHIPDFPDRFYKDKNGQKGPLAQDRRGASGRTSMRNGTSAPRWTWTRENGDNRALDFFGGTLRGIRQKLDYLADLVVSIIYLNPISARIPITATTRAAMRKSTPFWATKPPLMIWWRQPGRAASHPAGRACSATPARTASTSTAMAAMTRWARIRARKALIRLVPL